jgi:hypothetical protein
VVPNGAPVCQTHASGFRQYSVLDYDYEVGSETCVDKYKAGLEPDYWILAEKFPRKSNNKFIFKYKPLQSPLSIAVAGSCGMH